MPHDPQIVFHESRNLDEHVALIKQQVDRSVRDPELRALTLKVAAGKADEWVIDPHTGERIPIAIAWGEQFRLPVVSACGMKDAVCESQAIWNFAVLNIRYVLDPDGFDLFSTAKYTLLANAGDCDDFVIVLCAMHRLLGFAGCAARVVTTDARHWEHIYALVGFPKSRPTQWVPLDPTVAGVAPGWQYNKTQRWVDYRM